MKAEDVIRSVEELDNTLNLADKLGYSVEVRILTRVLPKKNNHQIVVNDIALPGLKKIKENRKVQSNGGAETK